jgi:hypothetical protein
VLVTRGKPTVVYPETALMFRLEAPVTISTASAPDAFQPVRQGDYEQRSLQRQGPPPRRYYYSTGWGYYPYYGFYPPFYYGPSLYFGWGYRGFHRRW